MNGQLSSRKRTLALERHQCKLRPPGQAGQDWSMKKIRMAEGDEVEEAGGALLPGAGEGGVEFYLPGTAAAVDADQSIGHGLARVEAAALDEVTDEEDEHLPEESGVLPEAVAAVDGGAGWEAGGEQVPGELEAELPE